MSNPNSPPAWMSTAGGWSVAIGAIAFCASAAMGGGPSLEGAIVAGALNPLFFIGVPLGAYWLWRAQTPGDTLELSTRNTVVPVFESPPPLPKKPSAELTGGANLPRWLWVTLFFLVSNICAFLVGATYFRPVAESTTSRLPTISEPVPTANGTPEIAEAPEEAVPEQSSSPLPQLASKNRQTTFRPSVDLPPLVEQPPRDVGIVQAVSDHMAWIQLPTVSEDLIGERMTVTKDGEPLGVFVVTRIHGETVVVDGRVSPLRSGDVVVFKLVPRPVASK